MAKDPNKGGKGENLPQMEPIPGVPETPAETPKTRTLRQRFGSLFRRAVEAVHPAAGPFVEELGGYCRINGVNLAHGTNITLRGETDWQIVRRQESGKIQVLRCVPGKEDTILMNVREDEIVRSNPQLFKAV